MSDTRVILVTPVSGGWGVSCPGVENLLMFTSGAHAEQSARGLGACLAGLGDDTCVAIHDRHNTLIGTAHYFAVQQRVSGHVDLAIAS